MKNEIWPVTIIMDRYSGIYSGGSWLAFNCEYSQIPSQVMGSDPEEMWFWNDGIWLYRWLKVGKGNDPQEALDSLYLLYEETRKEKS